jgi:hypothetical protein
MLMNKRWVSVDDLKKELQARPNLSRTPQNGTPVRNSI